MNRIFLTFLTIFVVAGLLAIVPVAHAQGSASLTASVDRDNLAADETFVLTLALNTPDGSLPQLSLSQLEDFRVISNSQSLQTSLINGKLSTTATYAYQLQPVRAGNLTIPGFSLEWDGQLLSTEPIPITVSEASSASATGPQGAPLQADIPVNRQGTHDLFIEAAADKQSVYVGEALKFYVRLYNSAMTFGQPTYEAPQFDGFWHPQEPEIKQYFANSSDGTLYDVTELTTWLYPTTAGQATIDPATITTPGGFFTRGAQIQSDPISIEVKPLPADAPADFSGAVGQFEIKANPDRLNTRLGEPVTLLVTLSGAGNWGTLSDPTWPEDGNWRIYTQGTQSQSTITNGLISGARLYEQLWTPLTEGQHTIPAIPYHYFDPATGQYVTITTQPVTIDVAPGDPGLITSLPQSSASGTTSTDTDTSSQVRPVPGLLTSSANPLMQQPGFLLLFLVPLGLVMGDLSLVYRKRYINTHASELRRSKAYKRARRQLKRLSPRSKNLQLEVARILLTYLEDQIQEPLTGLSHSALTQVLQDHQFSPQLTQRVIEILFTGEVSEYTPWQPNPQEQVVDAVMLLLEDLEKIRS